MALSITSKHCRSLARDNRDADGGESHVDAPASHVDRARETTQISFGHE